MSEDVAVFTTENLLQYGGIMFFTTGELPLSDSQRRAFTDFIRAGGGFVGVHSATDTFYQWPEYREIIGGGAPGAPAPRRAVAFALGEAIELCRQVSGKRTSTDKAE